MNCPHEDLPARNGFCKTVMTFYLMEQNGLFKNQPILKLQMNITVVKKIHNLKSNLLTLPDLRIIWPSQTYAGKIQDKHICDREKLSLPSGIRLWQDGAFLGHKSQNIEVKCRYENQEKSFCLICKNIKQRN